MKNNAIIRLIASALLLAMLSASIVACTPAEGGEETTAEAPIGTTAPEATTEMLKLEKITST